MVQIVNPGNGQIAGLSIAEITSVPYYELLHADPDRACRTVQVTFSRILDGFYRQMPQNAASLELLCQSCAIQNQTYDAQVKLYLLIRMLGSAAEEFDLRRKLEDLSRTLAAELTASSYAVRFFEGEGEYSAFSRELEAVCTDRIVAVAKKERFLSLPVAVNGGFYYTDAPELSEDGNAALVTNALTQHAGSCVSLQLIPTAYTDVERTLLEQLKAMVGCYAADIRMRQGFYMDSGLRSILDAYDYGAQASREPAFYYNFLVYSDPSSAVTLGSKLISLMEKEDRQRDSAYELVDLTGSGLRPGANLPVGPWVNSNVLVYQYREPAFWNSPRAPRDLLRLRYLMGPRELRTVFKLPIDDGYTIGLESKRVQANREKLNQNVISEDSFRVGVIQETAGQGEGMHAGIPLNDFTKHGLIVGMSGSGKTNFSLGMLLRFWKEFRIPFLAIEPTKSEYRSLIDAIPDLQIFTPGKSGVSPYIINPFLPPKNVTVESYAPSLMTAFKAAFTLPNPLPNVFMRAINAAYTKYGWKKQSTVDDPDAQPFGMYEFIRVFQEEAESLGYKGESKANIESAGLLRLISLIEQNSMIYDSIHTIPLEDFLSRPTVIELNAITDKEQKSLIMAFLLIMICIYTKNNMAGDGKLKNILLIDEAHVLLGGGGNGGEGADPKAATIEAVEDMIAEIRSFGTGIIIADQNPTKVGRNIVANTNVKVMFKLVEKENRDAVATTTNMSQADYDQLARMGVGQAMLHFGRLNTPLHIMTYDLRQYASVRQVVPDRDVAALVTYWNDPEHKKLLIPHRECRFNGCCAADCDRILRDDAEYLADRLVQEHLGRLKEKADFVKFLVRMDPLIDALVERRPAMGRSLRLFNCVKIKFLRKAILETPYKLSEPELEMILKHPNFLRQTEGGA